MSFLQPTTWTEALQARADNPDHLPVAGGTDVMVEFNFDRRPPAPVLDVRRVGDIAEWWQENGQIRIGAGVPYTRIIDEVGSQASGLAMAARTVASPQIRNRGTVGGNLATASPAGDSAPPLLATNAQVELRSVRGIRIVPAREFFSGIKRSVVASDELVAAVWLDAQAGPHQFSKIGPRNAMVISVASVALTLDPHRRTVGTGMGSVGPTPGRAEDAETFLAGELDAGGFWTSGNELPPDLVTAFADRVAASAAPIDDVRSTAGYRVNAVQVMARRTLTWAWADYQKGLASCG